MHAPRWWEGSVRQQISRSVNQSIVCSFKEAPPLTCLQEHSHGPVLVSDWTLQGADWVFHWWDFFHLFTTFKWPDSSKSGTSAVSNSLILLCWTRLKHTPTYPYRPLGWTRISENSLMNISSVSSSYQWSNYSLWSLMHIQFDISRACPLHSKPRSISITSNKNCSKLVDLYLNAPKTTPNRANQKTSHARFQSGVAKLNIHKLGTSPAVRRVQCNAPLVRTKTSQD